MDSTQRRKSTINLPAGMSETSSGYPLRGVSSLNSPARTMSPRTISNMSSPSKSANCSDRFIPCRSSSRLHTFELIDKASPSKEGGNETYTRLLRSELFGSNFGYFSSPAGGASQGSPMSPSKNMLRFKMEHSESKPNSPYSPSMLGNNNGFSSEGSMPPKPPRKVPKTPHKVTKLCDLGPTDSVCSVQWTREGLYISIGTYLGQVQPWFSRSFKMKLTGVTGKTKQISSVVLSKWTIYSDKLTLLEVIDASRQHIFLICLISSP